MGPRRGRQDRGARHAGPGTVARSARIVDTAFRAAYRVSAHGTSPLDRARRRALLKVVRAGATAVRHLSLAIRPFRSRNLGPFSVTLVEQRFGPGALGRAVVRVRHAEERIRKVSREEQTAIRRASDREQLAGCVRRFYGRMASFLREVDADLDRLEAIHGFLRSRPEIEPGVASVVVAGFPNVGKSSLVGRLSSARPKIASYPFTTVAVAVGHTDLGFDRLQVVDTPGVLGRPGQLNTPETEATAAVRQAASLVLFLVDPSESCGYPLAEQLRLLARWKQEFPQLRIVPVATKADLAHPPTGFAEVSVKSGAGIAELRRTIQQAIAERSDAAEAIGPEGSGSLK